MTREQLERLGEASLRQMAQRIGLRGARHLDRAPLLTGLAAYFARCADDEDEEPTGEAPVNTDDIPPALTTETMARLLEAQGERARATALRARMATPPPAPPRASPPRAEVALDGLGEGRFAVDYRITGAPPDLRVGLAVRTWHPRGEQQEQILPQPADAGRLELDLPHGAERLCVALGVVAPDGGFRPLARTAIVALGRPGAP